MRQLAAALAFALTLAACGMEPRAPEGGVTIGGTDGGDAGLWLIDLGTVGVGEQAERAITLRSTLPASTTLTVARLDEPFEIDLPRRVLAPGESLDVIVRFVPRTAGRRETIATITFEGGRIDLRLRGAAISAGTACLEVTPSALVFDSAPIDCQATQGEVSIRNTCTATAAVELRLSPAAASFGWSEVPPTPVMLRAGEELVAEVAFRPVATGPQVGKLLVVGGDGDFLKVALSGEGSAAARLDWTTVFPARPRSPYDLLIVVDGSEAMEPWLERLPALATGIEWWAFGNWFDVQIGVTTSSFSESEGCGGEGGRLLPIGDPEILTHETLDFAARLQALLDVGTCMPAGKGRPLEAALQAAGAFARPNAHLVVLLIGAEDDQGEEPVATYVTRLNDGNPRKAIAVAAVHPSASCGGTDDGSRLVGFAGAFAGWTSTICSDEWWEPYFGHFFGNSPRGYFLDDRPLDIDGDGQVTSADLHVEVNGVPLARTHEEHWVWDFDAHRNAVEFNPFFVPEWDTTVTVHYAIAAPPVCPPP